MISTRNAPPPPCKSTTTLRVILNVDIIYEDFINVMVDKFLAFRKVLLRNKLFEHGEEPFHVVRVSWEVAAYLAITDKDNRKLLDE